MTRSTLLPLLAGAMIVSSGCGSSSGASASKDVADATAEGSPPDAIAPAAETGADASIDGGMEPGVMLLVQSDYVTLNGLTSDGSVLYAESTIAGSTLKAVPIGGGTPRDILALGAPSNVLSSGRDVLVWSSLSAKGVSPLWAWTSSGPAVKLSSSSYVFSALSADGSLVLYLNNVNATATLGDFWVSSIDGTGATALLSSIPLQGNCAPGAGFAGNDAVIAYCGSSPGDAGSPLYALSAFSGPTWTRTDLSNGVRSVALGDTAVAVVTAGGNAEVIPLPNGPAKVVDGTGTVAYVSFASDLSSVFYLTSAGALKRSNIANPSPITLVGSGIDQLLATSPDLNWVMFNQSPVTAGGKTDLYLASTAAPGTPLTLSAAPTGSLPCFGCSGRNFTRDSSYAIYYANAAVFPTGDYTGTLVAVPTAGGMARQIGQNVWDDVAGKGTTIVFEDNFTPGSQENTGIADLRFVDIAAPAGPSLIMGSVDLNFAVTAAGDRVVFTFSTSAGASSNEGADTNGLYVAPIP